MNEKDRKDQPNQELFEQDGDKHELFAPVEEYELTDEDEQEIAIWVDDKLKYLFYPDGNVFKRPVSPNRDQVDNFCLQLAREGIVVFRQRGIRIDLEDFDTIVWWEYRKRRRKELEDAGGKYKWGLEFDKKQELLLDIYYDESQFLEPDNLKVTVVVPTARELSNGNFWRMVESLSLLDDKTDPSCFEILIVVNNRADDASDGYFQENQRHLQILRIYTHYLLTDEPDFDDFVRQLTELEVNQWRIQQLVTCLRRKIRIHPVDASSESKSIDFSKANYYVYPSGFARGVGGHIGVYRSDTCVIDFKDADCTFPTNYFLVMAENAGAAKKSIRFAIDVGFIVLPDIKVDEESTSSDRLVCIDSYYCSVLDWELSSSIQHYTSLKKSSAELKPEEFIEGPQLAVTAQLFRAMNGYPIGGARGEDFQAAHLASLNSDSDVFYQSALPEIITVEGKYDTKGLFSIKAGFSEEKRDKVVGNFLLRTAEIYQKYKNQPGFQQRLEEELERENLKRTRAILVLRSLVDVVINNLEPDHHIAAIIKEIPYSQQFVLDCINVSGIHDSDKLFEWIQNRFPILYGSPVENVNYGLLEGIIDGAQIDLGEGNPRDFIHVWRAGYFVEASRK